jgi:hypothetical protein
MSSAALYSHNLNDAAGSLCRLDQTKEREEHGRDNYCLLSAGERTPKSYRTVSLGHERSSR